MKGHILMSVKEIDRIPIMEKLVKGQMKVIQAADTLGLSARQIKRIRKRFKQFGAQGLIHKNRGKVGNRAISREEIDWIMSIVSEKYPDFGPTFALEKLKENHGVTIGRERLRLAMIDKGLWKERKRRFFVVHQQRNRRDREGELVQVDGSPYAWFEERGPYCTLLVYIDDATGKLKSLMFALSETTNDYFRATNEYITNHGKPVAFYLDRHGVFRVNTKRGGISDVTDSNGLTQFGRAMQELSISTIFANTPQAKGRVENANGTLQDRLVKELRLRGISTIEEGNNYLPGFTQEFNKKFAVKPKDKQDAHRPLLPSEDLRKILVKKHMRILSKNLEFQYQNNTYQVKTDRPSYALRHAPVMVLVDWDENVSVYYKGKKLSIQKMEGRPVQPIVSSKELYQEVEKKVRKPWKPGENHPWKHFVI